MTPSNAELREAILKAFGVESDEQYVDNKAKFLIEDLLPVFQAREQQLLTELLGAANTYSNDGDFSDDAPSLVEAVPVNIIEKYREGL